MLCLRERVGIPWLGRSCGVFLLQSGHEHLCDGPLSTGHTRDGGYATATIADASYAFPLGEEGSDGALCAAAVRRPHRLVLTRTGGSVQDAAAAVRGPSCAARDFETGFRRETADLSNCTPALGDGDPC